MSLLIAGLCILSLSVLTALSAYQWLLAIAALVSEDIVRRTAERHYHFLIVVPAHNEEATLPSTLQSLRKVDYPSKCFSVAVVADRCMDGTVNVAKQYGAACLVRSSGEGAKGEAIAWSIERMKTTGIRYDALVIIDADSIADPNILKEFNIGLNEGHRIQQGYNYLSNPWESPFTRLIAVTSVLKNRLFYGGKKALRLSGMLTGTGMCLSNEIIERFGWTAFSVGEDWEYSAYLLLVGERIYFNRFARVFARESHGMKQASRQRLRWATGRHALVGTSVKQLILQGITQRKAHLVDAAFTLVAPNYSTQGTLAIISVVLGWLLSQDPVWNALLPWSVLVLSSLAAYFVLGVALTEAPLRTLAGLPLIPVFLPWRLMIEVLGMLGYGRKDWGTSARRANSKQ
jgi:cellulose synthase/poly-beta-1,6-N-acetylglucosamine synthase-like glycosyltransferase